MIDRQRVCLIGWRSDWGRADHKNVISLLDKLFFAFLFSLRLKLWFLISIPADAKLRQNYINEGNRNYADLPVNVRVFGKDAV